MTLHEHILLDNSTASSSCSSSRSEDVTGLLSQVTHSTARVHRPGLLVVSHAPCSPASMNASRTGPASGSPASAPAPWRGCCAIAKATHKDACQRLTVSAKHWSSLSFAQRIASLFGAVICFDSKRSLLRRSTSLKILAQILLSLILRSSTGSFGLLHICLELSGHFKSPYKTFVAGATFPKTPARSCLPQTLVCRRLLLAADSAAQCMSIAPFSTADCVEGRVPLVCPTGVERCESTFGWAYFAHNSCRVWF